MSGAAIASVIGSRITLAASYSVVHVNPAGATAGLTFESDGDIISTEGGVNTDQGDWIVPRSSAGNGWQTRMVTISGTLSLGTADVWQTLSSNRSYGVTALPGNISIFTGTEQIGLNGLVVKSAPVTLEADAS